MPETPANIKSFKDMGIDEQLSYIFGEYKPIENFKKAPENNKYYEN
mgnify:CR=1 FL=1